MSSWLFWRTGHLHEPVWLSEPNTDLLKFPVTDPVNDPVNDPVKLALLQLSQGPLQPSAIQKALGLNRAAADLTPDDHFKEQRFMPSEVRKRLILSFDMCKKLELPHSPSAPLMYVKVILYLPGRTP
jgi:hypothetical protein